MKNNNIKLSIAFLSSVLATISFNHIYSFNIILNIIVLILFSFIAYYGLQIKSDKRKSIYAIIFSSLFSLTQIIGYNCATYDYAYLNNITTYLYTLLMMPIIYFISILVFDLKVKSTKNKTENKLLDNKHSFLIIFLIIFISWLPILISFYPGNFSYDAGTQLRMTSKNLITKYHPVIHTLLLGKTILLGKNLFSSYSIGIFFYSIIQMTIMALIFSKIITYLHQKKVPNWLTLIFLIIFMFLPTHSIFSFTTTKDIIFSGVFALLIINLIEMISNEEKFFKEKRNIITTIILLFLLLILRNNMLYAFIFFLPYTFIILKKYYKKLIIIVITPLVLFYSYNFILGHIFHISNGPRVEAFSFVIQQLARTYQEENLTKKEKRMIENVFEKDTLKNYNSHISDPIKSNFKSDVFFSDTKNYIKLYINLFKKYPTTYIDSWLDNIYPFIYLNDKLPDKGARTYIEITCLNEKELDRTYSCHKNIKPIYNAYYNLVNNATYQKIPILNLLMNMANYVWLLLLIGFKLLANKNYKETIPILILFSLLLTNLLGPVAIVRYIYPMMVSMPLLIYLLIKKSTT